MTTTDLTAETSTRAVAAEFLRLVGAGDPDAVATLFADTVDWKLNWPEDEHGRTATPWIIHRSTRADVADNFRALTTFHERIDTELERVLFDGAHAVVLGVIRQTAQPTGRAYRARFALHLTVVDGLITRYHIYEDSLAIAQAFAPGTDAAV
ncbi:nuclear transport factor 2 family protein [Nocardia callitridis]|uniref:Nuclear transport factor 2 family protein n=1 Tax=Nocardia callitridis TaxID=648753 RepID=A0ABP9JW09_9NOCA